MVVSGSSGHVCRRRRASPAASWRCRTTGRGRCGPGGVSGAAPGTLEGAGQQVVRVGDTAERPPLKPVRATPKRSVRPFSCRQRGRPDPTGPLMTRLLSRTGRSGRPHPGAPSAPGCCPVSPSGWPPPSAAPRDNYNIPGRPSQAGYGPPARAHARRRPPRPRGRARRRAATSPAAVLRRSATGSGDAARGRPSSPRGCPRTATPRCWRQLRRAGHPPRPQGQPRAARGRPRRRPRRRAPGRARR